MACCRSMGPTTSINSYEGHYLYPKRVALEPRPRDLWRECHAFDPAQYLDVNGDIAPGPPDVKEEDMLHMILAAGNASVDMLPIAFHQHDSPSVGDQDRA